MQRGIDKEGLAFGDLKFYNGVLPDGEPDNIVFTTDIAWGGGDSLSMPIAYVYGEDVYIHDVIFDKGDKSITKPRVLGKILLHKCRMGRMEANNGGDEYCDDIHRMLRDKGYSMNLTHKKSLGNQSKLSRIEQHAPTIRNFYFRGSNYRDAEYDKFMTELMTFSFTSKNLHDDAADSMAMLADFMYNGVKSIRTARRPI
jgi:predicted phage terminase large subunit-like protein